MTPIRHLVTTVLMLAAAAGTARADVCVTIDEAHDTFTQADRTAALIFLEKQFELEGERVAQPGCASGYTVSHVQLGNTIAVTIAGPGGHRQGTALGMDDLPALYSQMVRSLVTGRPMIGFNVVDRTNVTAAQASAERVPTDGFWYARLGYGALFGEHAYGTPAMGIGYRAELDSFGIDVSFLNYQINMSNNYSYYGDSSSVFAGSLLKLEGLYFLNPRANKSAYFGGGLSWGGTDFGRGWHGSGLQGELTVGYEMPRASTLRTFIQADAVLPFYQSTAVRYPVPYRPGVVPTTDQRYAPSLTVSIGLGWQKNRHGRHGA